MNTSIITRIIPMNIQSHYAKAIFGIFTLILCVNLNGQKLLESRQSSYYTYVYKLSDKEARKIYKNDIWKVDTSFFHTLVDSFQTDSEYINKLPEGHYLKTYSERNKQKLSITTVQNYDVFLLNNNTDLCVQVVDLKGNIIGDADLKVRWKKLHFNKTTQSYIDKESNQKGLLKVTYKGFTTYYDLNRKYNNSLFKRSARKVVYGTPIKYVWMPVNFVIHLPIDGVKSIIRGWSQGSINRTKYFFINSFEGIACLFDDSYCYNSRNKFQQKHKGYIVFNKPKYLPGDTVKFKAFLVTKNGKPIQKPLKVILQTTKKSIELTNLIPYRKGGYEYQFLLHDSLQLQLDRNYTLRLEQNERKVYITGSFKYEDYELSKNKLSLRVDETEHFRNKEIKLFVKGTDENDLNLMDARFELLIQPKTINDYLDKNSFIPDTILLLERKLEPTNETEVSISDSIFPKVNFDYEINVRLLSSDNEVISEKEKVSYYYELEKFDVELVEDSIHFQYNKNGVDASKEVIISAIDNFGNSTQIQEGSVPCTIELNPYYSSYTINSGDLSNSLDVSAQPALLQCYSERTSDSVIIVVDNPRKIPFSYNIYKKNAQESYGFSDSLNLRQKSKTKQNYFVSIRYLWGGAIKEDNYKIPLVDKKLNVSVTQPKIVYPGQKSKIEVLVTDIKGKPVEGVDLTAFSLTKKFNYSQADLPYLGTNRKNKSVINNFNFKDIKLGQHTGLNLDYDAWKILAGIDSIEYYKFLYPGDSIYRFGYEPSGYITQFAPFVISDGIIQPIHVIYVDSEPVYFSWSTINQPYSFRITSGYHQIKLRTSNKSITIDSMFFNPRLKLIFSINEEIKGKNIKIETVKPELSGFEQRLLYKYIFPYRNTFGERFAYIEQDNNLQLLSPESQNLRYNNLAGPVSGLINFQLIDSFSTKFIHEPFFEYEFAPGLLKMRSRDVSAYPRYLNNYQNVEGLSDVVLTKKALLSQWNNYLDSKRYLNPRYLYPQSTTQGNGRLLINFQRQDTPVPSTPLNILIFRYDNHEFLRVYPGNTSLFHQLGEGYYKLIFFYPGAEYHVEDSIYIQTDGLNYYEFKQPEELIKDSFSIEVTKLIEETIYKPSPYNIDAEKELKKIYNTYQEQFRYSGDGEIVEGFVYDIDSKEPIPGVTVVIKGTTFGTITDFNGHYSLKVPLNCNSLIFSFIGYNSEEKQIGSINEVSAELTASVMNLDEVVVVGYGTRMKSDLTASVAIVTTSSMLGEMPDVSGNISGSLQGKVGGVSITQNSGSPGAGVEIQVRGISSVKFNNTPLYIINGVVFTGDISYLNPDLITKIELLQGASATAIYGAQGANGVVIIETKAGTFMPTMAQKNKGADYDNTFFEAASQSSSIRENFSDYAFWKPDLITDKEGKASFEVIFPDDVTSWETFYLAMNGNKQSGQTKSTIKSYKPLMANLAVPRFLIQADTSNAIGKILNYSPDSVEITSKFEVNQESRYSKTRYCVNSILDTLSIIAESDSLSIKYLLEKSDGYFDGELRNIPVFPKGLEETKGNFYVLDHDTSFNLSFDPNLGEVSLYARADILDVIKDEISHVIKYMYSCNEQIASKLKALLAEKNICQYEGIKFRDENEIDKLIRLINKNQNENGLWGWWKGSDENAWISLHVLEALTAAQKQGYDTKINKAQVTENLVWEYENSTDFYTRLRILKILRLLDAQISYNSYITNLESSQKLSFNGLLQIIELKQQCNIKCNTDTLKYYQRRTLFGNIYYSDENNESSILLNDIQNSLLAYKILKADSIDNSVTLLKMRNYFLENRKTGYWRNTYESAKIIETILPDLIAGKSKMVKPSLVLKGDVSKTVTEFPFEMKAKPQQSIEISKTGDSPVYFTSYQRYWNSSPKLTKSDFEINTNFVNDSSSILIAGKETALIANVIVKKDAEFVMINIPIPGGCSYADKKNNFRNESYREYFKNETTIFCEKLPKGSYAFEIKLKPRFTGSYTLNPAKVELMYFPTFNANNDIRKVMIK
ncbi:MAG: carboxypeptidase-like regulatory domain-containing protein [Bacteroidales bacterium]|nr:carboxypeptidase-like regulatory domain-containing protein [Bacteroidales bacterium]MCB9012427.1 carboxypeptidase-like regulatory domain-containing protein [Bacteroidales bacterium]